MPFESKIFWQPKDEGFAKEYEDAYAVDAMRGRAAIADGVSSAMFSGIWARLLVEALANGSPDPAQRDAFVEWLQPLRAEWERRIDRPNLKFFQKMKLQDCGGGCCTVLWLETLDESTDESGAALWRYRCHALGDSCLFHVRRGQIVAAFPMQTSAAFDLDPSSLSSFRHHQDRTLEFSSCESEYVAGDVLALTTDALAAWIFRQIEAGNEVPWDAWAGMSDDAFASWLRAIRKDLAIRFDDTTLILLSAVKEIPQPSSESPQPVESEVPVSDMPKPEIQPTRETPAEDVDLADVALPPVQEEILPAEAADEAYTKTESTVP